MWQQTKRNECLFPKSVMYTLLCAWWKVYISLFCIAMNGNCRIIKKTVTRLIFFSCLCDCLLDNRVGYSADFGNDWMSFSFRDNKAPLNVGAQLKILSCFAKCWVPSALWPFTVFMLSKAVINSLSGSSTCS